jgi:hypothetical protein
VAAALQVASRAILALDRLASENVERPIDAATTT